MIFPLIIIGILIAIFSAVLSAMRALKRAKLQTSLKKKVESGAKESAVYTLLRLIEKNPEDNAKRLQAADLFMELGNYSEALLQLNSILTHRKSSNDVDEKEVQRKIAACYLGLNNLEEAMKTFLVIKKLDPNDAVPCVELSRIEYRRGKNEQALKYLEKAAELAPENHEILKELGILLFKLKKHSDSLLVLERIYSAEHSDPEINYYLGTLKYSDQNYKDSYQHFLKSRRDERFTVQSLLHLGNILRRFNKLDEAEKVFALLLNIKGLNRETSLELHYQMGELYLARQDIQNAIVQWEMILQHTSSFRDVREKLDQYEETRTNAALRAYMTSAKNDFVEICKKIAFCFTEKVVIIRAEAQFDSSVEIFANATYKNASTSILFKFFRGTSNIGQFTVRDFYERLRETKARTGICCASSEYTEEARTFSEGRVIELIDRNRLMKLLTKAFR